MYILKKISLFLLLVLTSLSCSDWLELLPPRDLVREEFWQTKEDVEMMLMSAYQRTASLNRSLFILGEIRADMVDYTENVPQDVEDMAKSNITPFNEYCFWGHFYQVIQRCNEVIHFAPLVKDIDGTFTDYKLQSMLSEAYFLRSLSYFYLVRFFNEVPLILEPYLSDNADFYVAKSTEDEVLDQITTDLNSFRGFAPTESFLTPEENKGRASRSAFDALLADISLWRFDYEAVIQYVERIEESKKFVLLPAVKWYENYYPGNSLESIFECQFDESQSQPNGIYDITHQSNPWLIPSKQAIEKFGYDYVVELARGEQSSIAQPSEGDFIIWKYVGRYPDGKSTRPGGERRSCNFIIYRFAEVLLMKAEALSQIGRFQEARDIINEIRLRADVAPVNPAESATAFEDVILEERSLELAYEGKRWFDLLRMGRRNDFSRKDKLIEIIVSNVPSSQKRILAVKLADPRGWYMPVSDTEMERNKNLVQNPYYDF